jgi:uncharacterized protein (UPF0335 family)
MNKKMVRRRLELLLKEQGIIEQDIKKVVMEYKGSDDDSLPYKHIIRTEFGLVI